MFGLAFALTSATKIAFIGCNLAGPPSVWATIDEPGAARCDLGWLEGELANLRAEGYIPVFTFQHNEVYIPSGSDTLRRDFLRIAEAGAAIVSGSQAHFPQGFAFHAGAYVHYGLGNLFFDQFNRRDDAGKAPQVKCRPPSALTCRIFPHCETV